METLLCQPSTIISWVSLLEVAITRQERDATEADQRCALLKGLPVSLLWTVDEPHPIDGSTAQSIVSTITGRYHYCSICDSNGGYSCP